MQIKYIILIIIGVIALILFLVKLYRHLETNLVRVISMPDLATGHERRIPIKVCPFCGQDKSDIVQKKMLVDGKETSFYTMSCLRENGGCGAASGIFDNPLDALYAWNTRYDEGDN